MSEIDIKQKVNELAANGIFWCCLRGEFVQAEGTETPKWQKRKGKRRRWNVKHKTALQAERLGVIPKNPEHRQIHEAYAAHCNGDEIPF